MGSQLKRLTMYSKVKNLFEKGLSISQISRTTKLDRKTVRKYLHMNEQDFQDHLSSMASRHHKLEEYEEFVRHRIEQCPDCSAAQVEDWLKEQYPAMDPISSRTVYAFAKRCARLTIFPNQEKPGGSIILSNSYRMANRRRLTLAKAGCRPLRINGSKCTSW